MRKILIYWFVGALVLGGISASLLKPLGIISKDEAYFEFEEGAELSLFEDASFYVEAADKAGSVQRVNVTFEGDGSKFVGTAYLPGFSDPSECRLFWDGDVALEKRLKSYGSGEFALAGDGYSAVFFVKAGGQKYDFLLKSVTGSKGVEALFINIDEEMGSIADMNSDPVHDTSCYGVADFGGNSYFMSIKGRGNATWKDGLKKPYNITFLEEDYKTKTSVSMIEGVETKKWSILANYADPSLLRNHIGYCLANELGIGLDSKFYDVWMNGDFLGNYLVTPKNDYRATKTGFILELDNYIDEEDPQFYLSNDEGVIESLLFTIKDNSSDLSDDELKMWMQEAWEAIEDFESEDYQNYIDVESWAKMYLIHELVKNYDVVNGSILMYRDDTGASDKLVAGPLWDLDNAMGTIFLNPKNKGVDYNMAMSADGWYIDSLTLDGNEYSFLQELGRHVSFKEATKEAYTANKYLFDELVDGLDETVEYLGKSALMNTHRWSLDSLTSDNFKFTVEMNYESNEYPITFVPAIDYYDYVINLRNYLAARVEFLNDNLK